MKIMMKKLLLCMMGTFLLLGFAGCSSDDDENVYSNADIVGTWELIAYSAPGLDGEVPVGERDLFVFNSNGEVVVVKNWKSYLQKGPALLYFPNESGNYEYSYDMEKQEIQFFGKTRKCIISNNEMRMEGYFIGSADGAEILEFIFIKK